jgi:hypothetical protein
MLQRVLSNWPSPGPAELELLSGVIVVSASEIRTNVENPSISAEWHLSSVFHYDRKWTESSIGPAFAYM